MSNLLQSTSIPKIQIMFTSLLQILSIDRKMDLLDFPLSRPSPPYICVYIVRKLSQFQKYLDSRKLLLFASLDNYQYALVIVASIMRVAFFLVTSALFSLNLLSHAIPLKFLASPKQPTVQRRAAYSVVAVDGGSAAISPSAVLSSFTLMHTSESVETVTAPSSSTPPSIETVVVTNVVSDLEPAKTVFLSLTQEVTKILPPTAIPSYIVVDPAGTPTQSSTLLLSSQAFVSASIGNCVTPVFTSTMAIPSSHIWTSTASVPIPLINSNWTSDAAHPPQAKHLEGKGPEARASTPSSSRTPPLTLTNPGTLSMSSRKTYDDGRWHTSYPAGNATSTAFSSASATAGSTSRVQASWEQD